MIRSACIGGCRVAEFSLGGGYCHFEVSASGEAKSCSTASLKGNLDLWNKGKCSSQSSVSIETVHTMIKVGDIASQSTADCTALVKRQGIGPVITFNGDNS